MLNPAISPIMEAKASMQLQAQSNYHNHSREHSAAAVNKPSWRNALSSGSLASLSAETSRDIVAIEKYSYCSPSPLHQLVRRDDGIPAAGGGNALAAARNAVSAEREDGKSPVEAILRRSKARDLMSRAALLARVLEAVICTSSFAVMAADKTEGWSGDSFDRYREYRFCLSVNVIGLLYSGFQVYAWVYHLMTGKHVIRSHLRDRIDFSMDQVLSYLLISASSAAATRVDEWVTIWGNDQFTQMASASIALAFLAFLAFAFSSLLSGYSLWTQDFISDVYPPWMTFRDNDVYPPLINVTFFNLQVI
ncbi:hypothetical protein SAY86_031789 [Trapa natans]|uniref:CASP-like protein n=1 Tax=Trapa natans TaxID=22666 RepID=A0AAN7M7P1_TRANT|nr:hypothetical protein SAY86_031789 [Trapa natans]